MSEAAYYIANEIAAVRAIHEEVLSLPYGSVTIREQLSAQAQNMVAAHRRGNTAVVFHIACWCPGLVGRTAEQIMNADFSQLQAQLSVAKEYGYPSWDSIPADASVAADFEQAVDWLMHGEHRLLASRLKDTPALATRTSAYGHRATLLHYLGANGVETQRQVCPYNAVMLAELLIEHGADINARANIYGGSTALMLIESSAHPAAAGVTDALVKTLTNAS